MNNLVTQSKRFFQRNSSTILTCVGSVGVVATAILTAKATPKALYLIEEAKAEKGKELTKFETITTAGPAYIPAILMGASTIACIFGASIMSKKQQAAMVSAYAFLDNSYKDYKKKVSELYGDEAQDRIKEEIAQDKYDDLDISVDDDKILFLDTYSMEYFESTTEDVLRAEYELNRQLAIDRYVTVNDFYRYLGVPLVEHGDALGWSTAQMFDMYWSSWIDFDHSKCVLDDGLEYTAITIRYEPYLGFDM